MDATAPQDQKNMCTVIKIVPENQDIISLYLETSDDKFRNRKAGQFASIRIMQGGEWSKPHPFTLAGAPEEPFLRLTIKKEGAFTSSIPQLKPGDTIKCMGPLGAFCKDIDAKPSLVLIAGGVGITPFLSVLRHFRNIHAGNAVLLFWVNKSKDGNICEDELKTLSQDLNLTVDHALSLDENAPGYHDLGFPRIVYEQGRLNDEVFKRRGVTTDAAFYLCGPPPMMEATLAALEKIGVPQESVNREKFSY